MANTTYKLVDGCYSWEQVFATALNYPAHTDIMVELNMVPKLPSYFTKFLLADGDGQKANYGMSLPDKRRIHVKIYDDHYKVHWDKRDPKEDPLGHLYHDAPHWLVVLIMGLTVVGVGAYIVYEYKKKKKKKKSK